MTPSSVCQEIHDCLQFVSHGEEQETSRSHSGILSRNSAITGLAGLKVIVSSKIPIPGNPLENALNATRLLSNHASLNRHQLRLPRPSPLYTSNRRTIVGPFPPLHSFRISCPYRPCQAEKPIPYLVRRSARAMISC